MDQSSFKGCKVILFDFGGTLDSDGGHWLDRVYRKYKEEGIDPSFDKLKDAFYFADEVCCKDPRINQLGLRSLLKYHFGLQFRRLGIDDRIRMKRIADSFAEDMEYYLERNKKLLKRLNRFYKIGIVSNFYGNLPVICDEAGMSKFLDVIIDSERVGVRKPDPDIFLLAIKEIGERPEDIIFVGDSYERDIVPSKRLGMKAIQIKGHITNLLQLEDLL